MRIKLGERRRKSPGKVVVVKNQGFDHESRTGPESHSLRLTWWMTFHGPPFSALCCVPPPDKNGWVTTGQVATWPYLRDTPRRAWISSFFLRTSRTIPFSGPFFTFSLPITYTHLGVRIKSLLMGCGEARPEAHGWLAPEEGQLYTRVGLARKVTGKSLQVKVCELLNRVRNRRKVRVC